ncbi:hypothetical protein LMH73_015620 [Vibrio splendidus]|nr:hypothetical protein [Vibrio splendidus]MCC4882906.1 hypothetical protein [Vibrio splendidus]
MKINFTEINQSRTFVHHRSETSIKVTKVKSGALITLIDEDHSATVLIENNDELEQLKLLIENSKINSSKKNQSVSDENIIFSVQQSTFGEPFEECFEFELIIANPNKQWGYVSMSSYLDSHSLNLFIECIEQFLTE